MTALQHRSLAGRGGAIISDVFDQLSTLHSYAQEAIVASADHNSGTSTSWSRPHLTAALLEAVKASGLDVRTTTPDALAPLDQFHGGGKEATRALAGQAEVAAGMRVLDVGGGLGGPARMLAVEYGAHVTILDLTADYLRAGALLTMRMGLTEQVRLCCGHALNLPFPDGSFEVVWTQNSG